MGCPYRKSRSSCRIVANPAMLSPMGDILKLIWWTVIGLFRSRASLEAEILVLRHQLNVLRRKSPKRLVFSKFDRLVFASLYRIAPRIVNALVIVKPEIVICWHRAGFRMFWRWKSRCRGGRPDISALANNRAHSAGSPRIEWVSIGQLRPNPRNARMRSRKQIRGIAASIRKFGFLNPVLVDGDNMVLAGRGRLEAARLEG